MNNHWGNYNKEYHLQENQFLGRVVEQNREHYWITQGEETVRGEIQGKLRKNTVQGLPVIGDWVICEEHPGLVLIVEQLARTSVLSRKVAGVTTEEQSIAANITLVGIVLALDGGRNYSVRSLERYLTIAWNSGAQPLVILNKADLAEDPQRFIDEAEAHAPGVSVLLTSAEDQRGIEDLRRQIHQGDTLVLIGPSGVGKSALTNALTGDKEQKTGANRQSDKRGRHTTTSSTMIRLATGGLLIDSPGLREIQLWGEQEGLDAVFQEISRIAENCRFRDCSHQGEPGCAVQEALQKGELSADRFESYQELHRELEFLEMRKGERQKTLKNKGKNLSKYVKQMKTGKVIY